MNRLLRGRNKTLTVPKILDADILAKVRGNLEMVELLTSLAKTMNS